MFWAYCVQNKTKIETEHSGATYQMSRSEDAGLVCRQCSCLSPGPALLGCPTAEQPPATGAAGERTGLFICRRQKYQLCHGTGELLSSSTFPLTAASWVRQQEFCLGEEFPRTVPAQADARSSAEGRKGRPKLHPSPSPELPECPG